jgi:formate dehydrogenase subunit delta
MSVESLVRMANDIGHFFAAEPRRADAVSGIASHIRRFWDPRMRRQIIGHLETGGEGLEELAREAIASLPRPE